LKKRKSLRGVGPKEVRNAFEKAIYLCAKGKPPIEVVGACIQGAAFFKRASRQFEDSFERTGELRDAAGRAMAMCKHAYKGELKTHCREGVLNVAERFTTLDF